MGEFDKLVFLYYEMYNLSLALYNMELDGKTDDELFLQVVDLLKEKRRFEGKLFSRFINGEEYSEEVRETIFNGDSPVSMRMKDYIILYENLKMDIDEDDYEDVVLIKEKHSKMAKLYSACSRNMFLIYMSFYQELIDSVKDRTLKEKLLSLKYYNSFTKHNLEECLVNFNFKILKENYVDLYLIVESLGLEMDLCNEMILDTYMTTIKSMIIQILSINDMQYADSNMLASSWSLQCMLRAALSLLSEKDYKKIFDDIVSIISEYSNDNNQVSVDIVEMILKDRIKDKAKVRKISIRPIDN